MPMIDIYAPVGTFTDKKGLAQAAAQLMMRVEGVPPIDMFKQNTAGFVHELEADSYANAAGQSNYVRVQVLTNADALNREKQLTLTTQMSDLIAEYGHDQSLKQRTWVLLTQAIPGGWGLEGHAFTNEELVNKAREELQK
ncbi:MAG TPA: hypothetical protein H9875_00540 [Candidatus Levilactobacillus faecigallinarum]|uniref:4-oxalocrotonate tautomerase n=1 Tax=Candidatus Levilactobacillus faecigallinarum TaxID=2838638 RepID=A0A9D1QPH3_9LACO|nr:hypothetical protein [Candidatus Levilactobacillus faecigallinarum]